MKLVMVKNGSALTPASVHDAEEFSKVENGRAVAVTIVQSRNLKHHRLCWALVTECYKHQTLYSTPEKLMQALKVGCGHSEELVDLNGEVHIIPSSISFEKLDQTQFRYVFDRMLDIIISKIIPGVDKVEFEQRIFNMIGEMGPLDIHAH